MDQNVFFRWVWRFNALALALVLLAAAATLAIPFLSWRVAPAIEAAIDPPPPAPEQPMYEWTIQPSREERTEGMLALQIPAPPYEPGGSYSGPPSVAKVVNYLFVDANTGATRWLFPTHKQVITATDYVTETMPPAPHFPSQGPATGIVFDVVSGDPAAFSFGKPAKYQVYASKPDGTGLTKLLDDLDEAPVFVPIGKDKIFVRAQLNAKPIAATFSLVDFKLIAQTDLSELTPK